MHTRLEQPDAGRRLRAHAATSKIARLAPRNKATTQCLAPGIREPFRHRQTLTGTVGERLSNCGRRNPLIHSERIRGKIAAVDNLDRVADIGTNAPRRPHPNPPRIDQPQAMQGKHCVMGEVRTSTNPGNSLSERVKEGRTNLAQRKTIQTVTQPHESTPSRELTQHHRRNPRLARLPGGHETVVIQRQLTQVLAVSHVKRVVRSIRL